MNHVTNSKVEPDIEASGGPTEDPEIRTAVRISASESHPGAGAAVHLLPADASLDALRREGTYMALCGALLPADGLPPWECPPGCECGVFCQDCVHRAAEQVELAGSAGAAR